MIKFTATATIKKKITATATIKTLSPIAVPCPTYNLIDGGQPQTIYIDINSFNLIDGGQP